MFKYILVFLLSLLFCKDAIAQKKSDTLLYYLTNNHRLTNSKDSASYAEYILPYDTTAKLYPVFVFSANGKLNLSGATKILPDPKNPSSITYDGPMTIYYETGIRKMTFTMNNGRAVDTHQEYYANGKFCCIKARGFLEKFVECRDTSGKILAENGNGIWIDLDEKGKIAASGKIVDSVREGLWHGNINDTGRYEINFTNGKPGKGVGYDSLGKAHPFEYINVQASYMGDGTLSEFLMQNIRVPDWNRRTGIGGRVLINFIVDRNGTPGNFKVLQSPDDGLSQEAIRVIALTTWNPALKYGMPINAYFTIPVNFTITGK